MLQCSPMEESEITVDEASSLRRLLFGNEMDEFPAGWKQGFSFRGSLTSKLNQKSSGPCGVLAAIQAYVIFELLFGPYAIELNDGLLKPELVERRNALARALATTLWRAGDCKAAFLVRRGEETNSSFLEDGMFEFVRLKRFRSLDSLLEYIGNCMRDFTKDGGIILFLCSIIFTRGIDGIKNDMDLPESHLIGNDGFCSQEVVNLIIIGRAVTNVFDGNLERDYSGRILVHRGIPRRSKIGFLSIYEEANIGDFYNTPLYPIWVIFGNCHYSVLFGTSVNILRNRTESFELIYTDCMSKLVEEQSFKVSPTARQEPFKTDGRYSVVKQCIYKRWPLASVE